MDEMEMDSILISDEELEELPLQIKTEYPCKLCNIAMANEEEFLSHHTAHCRDPIVLCERLGEVQQNISEDVEVIRKSKPVANLREKLSKQIRKTAPSWAYQVEDHSYRERKKILRGDLCKVKHKLQKIIANQRNYDLNELQNRIDGLHRYKHKSKKHKKKSIDLNDIDIKPRPNYVKPVEDNDNKYRRLNNIMKDLVQYQGQKDESVVEKTDDYIPNTTEVQICDFLVIDSIIENYQPIDENSEFIETSMLTSSLDNLVVVEVEANDPNQITGNGIINLDKPDLDSYKTEPNTIIIQSETKENLIDNSSPGVIKENPNIKNNILQSEVTRNQGNKVCNNLQSKNNNLNIHPSKDGHENGTINKIDPLISEKGNVMDISTPQNEKDKDMPSRNVMEISTLKIEREDDMPNIELNSNQTPTGEHIPSALFSGRLNTFKNNDPFTIDNRKKNTTLPENEPVQKKSTPCSVINSIGITNTGLCLNAISNSKTITKTPKSAVNYPVESSILSNNNFDPRGPVRLKSIMNSLIEKSVKNPSKLNVPKENSNKRTSKKLKDSKTKHSDKDIAKVSSTVIVPPQNPTWNSDSVLLQSGKVLRQTITMGNQEKPIVIEIKVGSNQCLDMPSLADQNPAISSTTGVPQASETTPTIISQSVVPVPVVDLAKLMDSPSPPNQTISESSTKSKVCKKPNTTENVTKQMAIVENDPLPKVIKQVGIVKNDLLPNNTQPVQRFEDLFDLHPVNNKNTQIIPNSINVQPTTSQSARPSLRIERPKAVKILPDLLSMRHYPPRPPPPPFRPRNFIRPIPIQRLLDTQQFHSPLLLHRFNSTPNHSHTQPQTVINQFQNAAPNHPHTQPQTVINQFQNAAPNHPQTHSQTQPGINQFQNAPAPINYNQQYPQCHICPICHTSYDNSYALDVHIRFCRTQKNYFYCNFCRLAFPTMEILNSHFANCNANQQYPFPRLM